VIYFLTSRCFIVLLLFLGNGFVFANTEPQKILSSEQAFQWTAQIKEGDRILISWNIADGYYLYRKNSKFISATPDISVATPLLPIAEIKKNYLGENVQIYRNHIEIEIPFQRHNSTVDKLNLEIIYQGCADSGVCYMPDRKKILLELPQNSFANWRFVSLWNSLTTLSSQQENIAASFKDHPVSFILFSFFGFGLLLAFTPCVFPMIPILSGIIVGQGEHITTFRAFNLSLCYVVASACAYALLGVLAGLLGKNLQIFFQKPEIIILISSLFVILACSMFGLFQLKIPSVISDRLQLAYARQQGGHLLGAGIMGLLSALAIGPCVTAPLAGALIYIGQTGNAVMGGIALFFLGLGMGLPLLVMGTSAGKLLPKSGQWMHFTQAIFGMGLLAVAVYLLERIVSPEVNNLLWAILVLIPFIYLVRKRLWKIALLVTVGYVSLMAVGIITYQQRNTLELLCTVAIACEQSALLPFQPINSYQELQQMLALANNKNQWVIVDFYADWCSACKEMENSTFRDEKVRDKLSNALLLKIDVTDNKSAQQALMKQFELIGPPAVLFFGPDQRERISLRVIGYMNSSQFLAQLEQVFQ